MYGVPKGHLVLVRGRNLHKTLIPTWLNHHVAMRRPRDPWIQSLPPRRMSLDLLSRTWAALKQPNQTVCAWNFSTFITLRRHDIKTRVFRFPSRPCSLPRSGESFAPPATLLSPPPPANVSSPPLPVITSNQLGRRLLIITFVTAVSPPRRRHSLLMAQNRPRKLPYRRLRTLIPRRKHMLLRRLQRSPPLNPSQGTSL